MIFFKTSVDKSDFISKSSADKVKIMSESDFTINFALETCIFEKLTNLANFEKFWDCVTLLHTSTIVFVTSAAYIALLLCMQLVAYFGHMF